MNNHPINQHYVPKLLLKNFSSKEGMIWCYDKRWNSVKEKSIDRVASEDFFYDKIPNHKESSFEYSLGKIENTVSPIIHKLVEKKNLNCLNVAEKENLSLFITYQYLRTKGALIKTQDFHRRFINKIVQFVEQVGQEINIENRSDKDLWFSMLDSAPELSSHLLKKQWVLGESSKMFYLSDNPIVFQNTAISNSVRGTLGLNSEGIEIYFPLSDSLLLNLLCEKTYKGIDGLTVFCKQENIENVNALQVIYSNKFIFSSHKTFELAEDMIAKGEDKFPQIEFN